MPTMTLDEITRLSPQERIALIARLWDSLADAWAARAHCAATVGSIENG